MKTVQTKEVLAAVKAAASAIKTRSSLPILACLKVDSGSGWVRFAGTDLDNTIVSKIMASGGNEPLNICAPADRLKSILGQCHGSVELEQDDKFKLTVRNGSVSSVNGLDPVEFPPVASPTGGKAVHVPAAELRAAISSVDFAMSTDEARYVINSICLDFTGGQLRLVATDGRRLAHAIVYGDYSAAAIVDDKGDKAWPQVVINGKTVKLLKSILPRRGDSLVLVHWTEEYVSFTLGDVQLVAKLVVGNYPTWRQVVPTEHKGRLETDKEDFIAAVKSGSLSCTDKCISIVINITPSVLAAGEGVVTITSNSPEIGESRATLCAACPYDGPELRVAVNQRYVLEALGACPTEHVRFEVADELSPVVFLAGNWFCVTMPMRLS